MRENRCLNSDEIVCIFKGRLMKTIAAVLGSLSMALSSIGSSTWAEPHIATSVAFQVITRVTS
jgi:hypothetical protein